MKKKILELGGALVTEKTSGMEGMLTLYQTDMSGNEHYLFQPAGLSPETQEPLETFWINDQRIVGGTRIEVELPTEVLDTQVEDKATGFKGTAIALLYHLNGCVHFDVKSKGTIKKTGQAIKAREFDMRRLKGPAIKELSKQELKESKERTPSPERHPSLHSNS